MSEETALKLNEFLQYLISGLAQGSIYALIALGYTMVYGILKLINFAHGEFYMVGSMIGVFIFKTLGLPFFPGLLLGMLCTGLVAIFVERVAYRPLRKADRIAPLITALAVSIILLEGTRLVAGPNPRPFPQALENTDFQLPILGGIFIQKTQIIIFAVSLSLMGLLHYFVQFTKTGKAMRAVSEDFDASQLMGIPLNRIIATTFFIGASLAGAGGILVGMHFNQAEPFMGQLAGLKAFTAAVLGGIGVIPGAVTGALALGVCEALVVGYGQSSYRDAIAFGILILVLMVRPWGLMGTPERTKV